MKFSYKFSNLLGTVYRKGNLTFTKDGNSIISPVGNKVTVFDLKNNRSETLPIDSQYDLTHIALSPCGMVLITINEYSDCLVYSLVSKSMLHYHHFARNILHICYSPDGKYVAVAHENTVIVYNAPGAAMKQLNAFHKVHVLKGFYDDVQSITWSSDSRMIAACSKDMSTRVSCVHPTKALQVFNLGGHRDSVIACFFEDNSPNVFSVNRSGGVLVWHATERLNGLLAVNEDASRTSGGQDVENEEKMESGVGDHKEEEGTRADHEEEAGMGGAPPSAKRQRRFTDDGGVAAATGYDPSRPGFKPCYERPIFYSLRPLLKSQEEEEEGGRGGYAVATSSAYHAKTRILITGFSTGAFFLHEMPDFNLIHSLSIADQSISTICFNCTGDWIGLACSGMGQLIVWEWQSETYVLKQQGHYYCMSSVEYSPDGQFLVTGGDDGKVKVWNATSGFCFVTFTEHTSGISQVCFTRSGKAIVSASLDGTVRAFDMTRYRNFKTFTSPRPTQFSCLALDSSSEIVCAGSHDSFEIFEWSMQTGHLLEIFSGHEAPVSGLSFSPCESVLVSASWDKSVRIWQVYSAKGKPESVRLVSDALTVTFRPDGIEYAVATINGQVTFFNTRSSVQTGSIDGRNDLGSGRRDADLVTARQVLKGKSFTTLCYSADGECILAAGLSKNVCIYHVRQQLLLKKFEIVRNRSFDGVDEFINRRKMTDFGNIALVEKRLDRGESVGMALPGVRQGDMASRIYKPEVRVSDITFSPTGRSWAAATTEGLLIYSLDHNMVFDPLDLEVEVTTVSTRRSIRAKDHSMALMMALKLKEHKLVMEVVENVPPEDVEVVAASLPDRYVERFVAFLSDQVESTRHLEFYLEWTEALLMSHGQQLKNRSMQIVSQLHDLHRTLIVKRQHLEKICDFNKYTLQFILSQGEARKAKELKDRESKMADDMEAVDGSDDDKLVDGKEVLFNDDDDDDNMLEDE